MNAPVYTKSIQYDRESRDYAFYLDEELVGFARTYQEAEATLDQLVFELLNGQYFREAAEGVEAHRTTAAQTADIVAELAELPLSERTIALAGPVVELDDRDLETAYQAALAHPETQTQRWQRALQRGYDHLADEIRIGLQDGAYFWHPDSDTGDMYRVTPAECQCKAFVEGQPCKHRASALILSFLQAETQQQAA